MKKSRIERLDQIWNTGVDRHERTYSTSDVARICGLESSSAVLALIRKGKIKAKRHRQKHWRRTLFRIAPKALAKYMVDNKIYHASFPDEDFSKQLLHCQTLGWISLMKNQSLSGECA